jgi:hypothetical protein
VSKFDNMSVPDLASYIRDKRIDIFNQERKERVAQAYILFMSDLTKSKEYLLSLIDTEEGDNG